MSGKRSLSYTILCFRNGASVKMKKFLCMMALSVASGLLFCGCATSAEHPPVKRGELAGTYWKPVDSPRCTYIEFTVDGRMVGNTGCNRFFGPVAYARGKRIRLGPLAATRNPRAPAAEQKYEERFFSRIEETRGYVFDGDRLTFYNEARQPVMKLFRLTPRIRRP